MNSKPRIGIVPSFDEGERIITGGKIERVFLRREYTRILAAIGAVPIILNPDMTMADITSLCDGIVISGGEDIDPKKYGQKRIKAVKKTEPGKRFAWETKLINACDTAGVPILGICYGMQRLNVHYGGTLYQDIPSLFPANIGHDKTLHDVIVSKNFLGLIEAHSYQINSRHHQAVEHLGDGLTACATASDGIVEAIAGHGHYGIQWHPESDGTGQSIYVAFVALCMSK